MKIDKKLKGKLYGYFVDKHGAYEYRRNWLRVPVCPFCSAEEKLGISVQDNRVHCFRCGAHGSPINVIMDWENLSFRETLEYLKGYVGTEYVEPKVELIKERQVILPLGYMNIRRGDHWIGEMARKYWVNIRKLSLEYAGRTGIGYVQRKEEDLFGYLIFPYYANGKVIYYQTRRYFGNGPKFNNPKYEDFGIGKNQILYNEDALKIQKELNLVESVINAQTMGKASVALSGKTASPTQLTKLLKSRTEIFNIGLDNDAWTYAKKLAHALIPYKSIRLLWFENPEEDINDLGKKHVNNLIKNTPLISNHRELRKYINGIEDNQE